MHFVLMSSQKKHLNSPVLCCCGDKDMCLSLGSCGGVLEVTVGARFPGGQRELEGGKL